MISLTLQDWWIIIAFLSCGWWLSLIAHSAGEDIAEQEQNFPAMITLIFVILVLIISIALLGLHDPLPATLLSVFIVASILLSYFLTIRRQAREHALSSVPDDENTPVYVPPGLLQFIFELFKNNAIQMRSVLFGGSIFLAVLLLTGSFLVGLMTWETLLIVSAITLIAIFFTILVIFFLSRSLHFILNRRNDSGNLALIITIVILMLIITGLTAFILIDRQEKPEPELVIDNTIQSVIRRGVIAPADERVDDPILAYNQAIADANVIESDEFSNTLTAITPENEELIWTDDGEYLLVAAYTTYAGYQSLQPQEVTYLPDGVDLWVTAVPDVQKFCGELDLVGDALDLRLEQLLGLPPTLSDNSLYERYFAEFWVSPQAMFRPTSDPEIFDSLAGNEFQIGGFEFTSPDYTAWFTGLQNIQYEGQLQADWDTSWDSSVPYPWTRLGYTYDWGSESSDVGMSEFIVSGGSQLIFNQYVLDERAYCDMQSEDILSDPDSASDDEPIVMPEVTAEPDTDE